jgi:hypothetical protein
MALGAFTALGAIMTVVKKKSRDLYIHENLYFFFIFIMFKLPFHSKAKKGKKNIESVDTIPLNIVCK